MFFKRKPELSKKCSFCPREISDEEKYTLRIYAMDGPFDLRVCEDCAVDLEELRVLFQEDDEADA